MPVMMLQMLLLNLLLKELIFLIGVSKSNHILELISQAIHDFVKLCNLRSRAQKRFVLAVQSFLQNWGEKKERVKNFAKFRLSTQLSKDGASRLSLESSTTWEISWICALIRCNLRSNLFVSCWKKASE